MSALTEALGIEVPVIQAPIGDAATLDLVVAVSEAGGLGMYAGTWRSPSALRRLIRDTRTRTSRPFGVNLVLAQEGHQRESVAVCLDEGVPIVSFFWGDPAAYLPDLASAGVTTMLTVGSAIEARAAQDLGIDIVVAQGSEAGGHVWGDTTMAALLPAVCDAVSVPVVAAGGVGDGRGVAAAMSLGAQGVWLGTRFVATRESGAHPVYKQALVDATETDTVRSRVFDLGWPDADHRTLRNVTVDVALASTSVDKPGVGDVLGGYPDGSPVYRYDSAEPLAGWTGRIEEMCLYAGESCGVVNDIPPAGELVKRLWREATA